jgi:hypothetical protein
MSDDTKTEHELWECSECGSVHTDGTRCDCVLRMENEELRAENSELREEAVSYEGGEQQIKDVELANQEHDEAIRAESDRLESLVDRVVGYLEEDRLRVWKELSARQVERTREARRAETVSPELGVMPDIVGLLAKALFTLWQELSTRDVEGLQLVEGWCITQNHTWFEAVGDPLLMGPKYKFVIDPAPRGIRIEGPLVIEPFSTFVLGYDGKVVDGDGP